VATPREVFVTPERSPLAEVTRALGGFSEQVARLDQLLFAEGVAEAERRAEAEFVEFRDQAKSLKEAISKGLIDRSESPVYQRWIQEAYGRLAADRIQGEIVKDMAVGTLSEPGADFEGRAGEIIDEMLEDVEGRDEAFNVGLARQLNQHLAQTRSQFVQQRAQQLEKRAAESVRTESYSLVATGITEGFTQEEIAASLDAYAIIFLNSGGNGTLLNENLAQGVIDYARERLDTNALNLLDKIPTGPGAFLGGIGKVRRAREAAEDYIAQERQQQDNWYWTTYQRDRNKEKDRLVTEIVSRKRENPQADISDLQDELEALGLGEVNMQIPSLISNVVNVPEVSDPWARRDLQEDIWVEGKNIFHVGGLYRSGQITEDDYNFAVRQIQIRDAGDTETGALPDPVKKIVSQGMISVGNRVKISADITGVFPETPADREAASYAQNEYGLAVDWLVQQNYFEGKSPLQIRVELRKIEDRIVEETKEHRAEIEKSVLQPGPSGLILESEILQDLAFADRELLDDAQLTATEDAFHAWRIRYSAGEFGEGDNPPLELFRSFPAEVQAQIARLDIPMEQLLDLLYGQRLYRMVTPTALTNP
jgi:hypothetical protein